MENALEIKQSNAMNEARYKLSMQEQRLLLTIASMIQDTDTHATEYSMTAKQLSKLWGISLEQTYKKAVDMLKRTEITKMGISNAMKNVVESSKKHLEAIFSKITGKSMQEAQKERTELLNAQKERERLERQKEDRGRSLER